jgi:hypothetical protein
MSWVVSSGMARILRDAPAKRPANWPAKTHRQALAGKSSAPISGAHVALVEGSQSTDSARRACPDLGCGQSSLKAIRTARSFAGRVGQVDIDFLPFDWYAGRGQVTTIRTAYGFAGLVSGDSEFQPCGLKDGTERSDGWVATG